MGFINLAGRKPLVVRPISGRLIAGGVCLLLISIGAIIYGFKYRFEKQELRTNKQQSATVASDAATSNRPLVEGGASSFSGLPIEGSPTATAAAAQPVSGSAQQNPPSAAFYPSPQGIAYYQAAMPQAQPQIDSPEQLQSRAAARQYEREQQAIEGPTGSQNQLPATSGSQSPTSFNPAVLAGLTANTGQPPQSQTIVEPQSGYVGQNAQADKRQFNDGAEGFGDDYLKTIRTAPLSRWIVQRGTVIPASLPSKVVSDLPGDLIAEVVRDVYDSPTQKYVEIPAGSRLVGEYNSSVSYGQNRVQIVWTALYFPDGSYIDLDRMPSHSADGSSGLQDQVDNHWRRTIGGVVLSSLLSAGLQVSQNRTNGSVLAYPSTGQVVAGAVGTQASELGQQITNRNLNVQPTLKIRPGEIFGVSVKKDIVFAGPYQPMEVR